MRSTKERKSQLEGEGRLRDPIFASPKKDDEQGLTVPMHSFRWSTKLKTNEDQSRRKRREERICTVRVSSDLSSLMIFLVSNILSFQSSQASRPRRGIDPLLHLRYSNMTFEAIEGTQLPSLIVFGRRISLRNWCTLDFTELTKTDWREPNSPWFVHDHFHSFI